jgi:hypothetical protein
MRTLIQRLNTRKKASRDGREELPDRRLEDYQNTVKKFWRWLKAQLGTAGPSRG